MTFLTVLSWVSSHLSGGSLVREDFDAHSMALGLGLGLGSVGLVGSVGFRVGANVGLGLGLGLE